MSSKQLETIEKIIDADPNWKLVREKIQKALDNQPESVTLEEALKQVKIFRQSKHGVLSDLGINVPIEGSNVNSAL